jgi:hypothetical protein
MNWTTNLKRKRGQCSFIVQSGADAKRRNQWLWPSHLEAEAEELVETLPSAAALPDGAGGGGRRPGLRRGVLARCLLPEKEAPAPVEADPLIGPERCTRHQSKKIQNRSTSPRKRTKILETDRAGNGKGRRVPSDLPLAV